MIIWTAYGWYSLGELVMTKICFFGCFKCWKTCRIDTFCYVFTGIFGGCFFPRSWEQCTKWRETNHLPWINIKCYLLTKKHGILQDQERYVLVSNKWERTSRGHCHRLWIYYTMYIYIHIYKYVIHIPRHRHDNCMTSLHKLSVRSNRYSDIPLSKSEALQILFCICFVNTYLIYDTMQRPSSWWYMVLDFILKDMIWYKKP